MKIFAIAILTLFSQFTFASFEGGIDAFNRGDYASAAKMWQPLARAGDSGAARNLARLYHEGLGVKVDYETARHWYQFAADKCNATAQNNLGLMYLNGQGVAQDNVRAFRLFEAAAKQALHADADAMGNLAGMYMIGLGTQPNAIEAYKWYVLYGEFTTDPKNREKLKRLMPQVESMLTARQKSEALRRVASFQKERCIKR